MKLPALALLLLACAAAAQSLPEEARKLVEKRAAEVHKIDLAYAQALDALLAKYRAAGQAANAKAVEALIATAEGKKPDAGMPAKQDSTSIHLDRIVGKWKRDNGMLYDFRDTGSGVANGLKFTLGYDAGKKEISIIGSKYVDTLKFSSDPDILRGTDRNGRRYTLTRIK